MTKYFICLSLFCLLKISGHGQKPNVNLETYKTWDRAFAGDLSGDGNFAMYSVTCGEDGRQITHVCQTSGKPVFSAADLKQKIFSRDSRYVLGVLPGDTLLIYDLNKGARLYLTGIRSFNLHLWNSQEHIFLQNKRGEFSIANFSGKILYKANNVLTYQVSDEGSVMACLETDSSHSKTNVVWVQAAEGKRQVVFSGTNVSDLILDPVRIQLAFLHSDGGAALIGFFKPDMPSAKLTGIHKNMRVTPYPFWSFSHDGSHILFSLQKQVQKKIEDNDLGLEVWSYEDEYLRSNYLAENRFGNDNQVSFLAALDLASGQSRQLTHDGQTLLSGTLNPDSHDFFVIESRSAVRSPKWRDGYGRDYYLGNCKSGALVPLMLNQKRPTYRWYLSPSGRYTAFYDYSSKGYKCYDAVRKAQYNISSSITCGLARFDKLYYDLPENYPAGIAGWSRDEKHVFIQGTYDIWQADAEGTKPPISLTGGYGDKMKIIFSPAQAGTNGQLSDAENILLTAFDTKNKDYGFYTASIGYSNEPKKLSMQPVFMEDLYVPLKPNLLNNSKNGFLLRMQHADQAPNYFFSKDLKKFRAISDVNPQDKWNWMKAELLTYKDSLGNELQGVLYKPKNFDPKKKYPVIFGVYELQSNHLNLFYHPDPAGAMFSVPLMVSSGYLVFLPDVKAVPLYGGEGLTRCIVAGADHLAQYSWADTSRMALAGHSIGGFVTNYAVTHCNRFKAAIAGAGISNMITAATDLFFHGAPMQEFLKECVFMMQADLADDVQAYIRNSPILSANQLTTPLLLVHNDHDGAVRYEQSRSFFIELRRLQKPCWWLNYTGGDHHVSGNAQRLDYNIKIGQFFDHYLKGKPMPDWMKAHLTSKHY